MHCFCNKFTIGTPITLRIYISNYGYNMGFFSNHCKCVNNSFVKVFQLLSRCHLLTLNILSRCPWSYILLRSLVGDCGVIEVAVGGLDGISSRRKSNMFCELPTHDVVSLPGSILPSSSTC
jgi:hypothetical protein